MPSAEYSTINFSSDFIFPRKIAIHFLPNINLLTLRISVAKRLLCIDQVPFYFVLGICYEIGVIGIFIDIVYHHFFQIGVRHFLQTRFKSELISVTSGSFPKFLDSLLFLFFRESIPFFLRSLIRCAKANAS